MSKAKVFTEEEVKAALNQLVSEGKLHLLIRKDGTPFYVNNCFQAGYDYAKQELLESKTEE